MNKFNFCNKLSNFKNATLNASEKNIFFDKIEIWPILKKKKKLYGWKIWTFVTDEYLKIEIFNIGEQKELL